MISIGDVVRELATNDGLELTRENLHATSKKYMTAYGQDFFPKQIIKKIKESDAPCYLVSGIRPPSDAQLFKDAFGEDFFLESIPHIETTASNAIIKNSGTYFFIFILSSTFF